jgi:hypothetical protein
MWDALLDELREVVWWASVTWCLSAIGVGVAVALAATLAI